MNQVATQRVIIVCVVAVTIMGCAARWTCPLGTMQEQFEIRVLSGVFVTSRVAGVLYPLDGDEWLAANEPIIIVWQHPAGEVTELRVGADGRFSVSVPPGHYCFRASARGFTATVGRIDVRNSAPARSMEIRLPVAN